MAIVFTQERKKQRYLILALVLIVFFILLVLWQGFFKKEEVSSGAGSPVYTPPKININWEVLKNLQLQELQIPEEITSFEGEIGRDNPFIPY